MGFASMKRKRSLWLQRGEEKKKKRRFLTDADKNEKKKKKKKKKNYLISCFMYNFLMGDLSLPPHLDYSSGLTGPSTTEFNISFSPEPSSKLPALSLLTNCLRAKLSDPLKEDERSSPK